MKKRLQFFTFIIASFLVSLLFSHFQLKTVYTWTSNEEAFFDNNELTVVTYNIRYGKGLDGKVDLNRTIETLKKLDADIIALQEVERYSFRSLFTDQVTQLADGLGMNAIFYPSLAYPGLYYGNVILTKLPIVDSNVLVFKNSGENRSAIIVSLELSTSDQLYVINTHLGLNKDERLEAIDEIYQLLKEKNKPVLVMGDLNSTPTMFEYEQWTSHLTKSNEGIPLQTFYKRDWQIDYIFHSRHFDVNNVVVIDSDASDHYPIAAMFSLSE